ncbi:uncharacterized protein DUF1937 [Rhodobacter aestuarii]|uniref:DUF1937 domain-containing protein n=1 Tax=Rhodobacter aestuarii TaxID=453582 RepID=A0A1N7M7W9_9RHOB|nr:DUF1937 family protein [Rhodobacter aestuarii]PTV94908.1 uncharacterized protein DUF1937 [Rhodobacter aestuarii]SIS82216.1 protein of unknown function [Rhodobacter aestuarii]
MHAACPRPPLDWAEILTPNGPFSPLVHLRATPEVVAQHAAGLAYLATPYTRKVMLNGRWNYDKSVTLSLLAAREGLRLARVGVTAVSPIVQAAEGLHAQAGAPGPKVNPLDRVFWTAWCRPMFAAARLVVVPAIPGWDESEGVFAEVTEAVRRNMPVFIYGGNT